MIVRTKGIKWFFLILLCFLYIYNPAFSSISTMHFVALISFLIIATKWGNAKQILRVVTPAICLLTVMLFYRLIMVLTSNSTILSAVFDPLVMLVELIPASIAIVLIAKEEKYKEEYADIIEEENAVTIEEVDEEVIEDNESNKD